MWILDASRVIREGELRMIMLQFVNTRRTVYRTSTEIKKHETAKSLCVTTTLFDDEEPVEWDSFRVAAHVAKPF